MSVRDNEDYKKRQLDFYESNAAGWEKWAAAVADQAEGFNRPLIDAAAIGAGTRVLDLASGAGEPALSAARAVGSGGLVTASDQSAGMLGIAERRAKDLGLSNMAFEIADMEALPFDDGTFDAVISRFGIMYSPDPAKTLAECRRVLKSGGAAAFMVWGPTETNSMLWTVMEVGNQATGHFTEEEAIHPFCFGEPDSLAPLMTDAGFTDTAEADLRFAPEIPTEFPFWTPFVGMNFGGALEHMSDAEKAALDDQIRAAFEPTIVDGKYHVTAHVRIASGRAR